jgi:hypothetical protein
MKTNPTLYLPAARSACGLLIIGLLGVSLTFPAPAQSVFQANLSATGGGSQLNFGRLYLRAVGNQVDFVAVIFPFGTMTSDFTPVLNVPGVSFNFALGEATRDWLHGTHTVADQNPFLPAPLWRPHSYDEDGNPIYVDAAVIRLTDIYTGQFTLPDGFADDLLAGLGHVSFNNSIGGTITVMAVPEPTIGTLLLVAGVGWRYRRRLTAGSAFSHCQVRWRVLPTNA